jgi:hypothetical protein
MMKVNENRVSEYFVLDCSFVIKNLDTGEAYDVRNESHIEIMLN